MACLSCAAGLDQNTLLLYNNVLALPLMTAFMLLATSEAAEVAQYPQASDVPELHRRWHCLLGAFCKPCCLSLLHPRRHCAALGPPLRAVPAAVMQPSLPAEPLHFPVSVPAAMLNAGAVGAHCLNNEVRL